MHIAESKPLRFIIYQIKKFDAAESGKHPMKMKSIPKSVSGADEPYNKQLLVCQSLLKF
jgi:hypothetical protein